jgi:hypothetical protein
LLIILERATLEIGNSMICIQFTTSRVWAKSGCFSQYTHACVKYSTYLSRTVLRHSIALLPAVRVSFMEKITVDRPSN